MADFFDNVQLKWNGPKALAEIQRATGKGLDAAARLLANRLKQVLSDPAPRKKVVGVRGMMAGVTYYRATTRATPGAPPRKLSSRLRTSIATENTSLLTRRVGTNVKTYPLVHEKGRHPWLMRTADASARALAAIIGGEANAYMRSIP